MEKLIFPRIESIDVEDLLTLPEGYRYELHGGNLVIMTPSTYWHKFMARRLVHMLYAAGLEALQDPGVLGDRPRDNRLPDVGVLKEVPADRAATSYSNLPGSAFLLVVEIVSENSRNGEYTDKMEWYAQRGIPVYWIADQLTDRDDDGLIQIYRLPSDGKLGYVWERSLLLSELELEYQSKSDH